MAQDDDAGHRPPEVDAAIKHFAFRLRQVRDQAKFEGTESTSSETLADAAGLGLNTVKSALRGKNFPSRRTVAEIGKACKDPGLVQVWDVAREVIDKKSPRYGQPWPSRAPGMPLPTLAEEPESAELEVDEPQLDELEPIEPVFHEATAAGGREPGVDDAPTEDPSPGPPDPRRARALVIVAVIVVAGIVGTLVALRLMTPAAKPEVRFDALGGSTTSYIEVYRGPSASANDKTSVGGYESGDTARAVCKTQGRLVNSDTDHGEEARSSTTWVQLDGQLEAFATMTYADMGPNGAGPAIPVLGVFGLVSVGPHN